MQEIFDLIDKDELVKMLSNAVDIKSTNPTGNEKPMCEYVEGLLKENGIEYSIVPVENDRYDILAKIKGATKEDAIVFTGHMDVVPVSDDEMKRWNTPPFTSTIKDGYEERTFKCTVCYDTFKEKQYYSEKRYNTCGNY